MKASFSVMLLLHVMSFVGCATNTPTEPSLRGSTCNARVLDRMYFGMNSPRGSVTSEEWKTFLGEVVTTRFPAGLTVLEARGQWRGASNQTESENSRIVEVIHDDSAETERHIAEITSEYKTRFEQEAVLVVRTRVSACLN